MRTLLALAGIVSLAGASPPGPAVQTLQSESHPITAFAQSGSDLAWLSPGQGGCNVVHVLALDGTTLSLPKPGTSNVTCRWDVGTGPVSLALGSSQGQVEALWTLHEVGPVEFDYVLGADATEPLERRFTQVAHTRAGAGLWLGGIAGDGSNLVYSVTSVAYVNQVACLSGGSCRLRIDGGGIHRVVGRRDPLIPGTGPALELAVGGGRIAYVPPSATVGAHGVPQPSPVGPIQLRTVGAGPTLTVSPPGMPLALALSANVLAVLAETGGQLSVAWYDPATGNELGSVPVPATTSPELAASDQLIVYRNGKQLRAIDLTTRAVRTLVRTNGTPIGLSLEGSRLAWAENAGGKGAIRAIFVAGRG